METKENIAVLFDFDGVVVDTETQYSRFWHRIGADYLGRNDLEGLIKGQTLTHIYEMFFKGKEKEQREITQALNRFEEEMSYEFIPGFPGFMADLRKHGIRTAVVTSSNRQKMEAVYSVRPELRTMFDRVLTAEMFAASKPAPDCFLLGMEVLGTTPDTTYVFEDSFNGLKAGMASGAVVIGLATTNKREDIAPLCHRVIDDFQGFSYDKMREVNKV